MTPRRNCIIISSVTFILTLIPTSTPLRFCYNGEWHQTGTGKSCSLGIAFPHPVPISCAYENDPSLVVKTSFQSDACIDQRFRITDFQSYNPAELEHFAHNLPDLQVIYHHVATDELDNSILNITKESPDLVDLSECAETCGAVEELDPSSSSSSEEAAAIYAEEMRDLKEQTLRLGDYMYDITFGGDGGNRSAVQLDYHIVNLFKRAFDVITGTCPDPFLPPEFNKRVMNGFLYLLSDSGTEKIQDIADDEYEDILDVLEGCMTKKPSFTLEGQTCSSKAVAKVIVIDKGDGQPEAYEYKQDDRVDFFKYDLFIDAAWKVVDIVHAVCFARFAPNHNMHHRYELAMEQLFTPRLHRRWLNPTKLINNDAWGSWFLVDINSTLLNLYACQRAAYMGTPFSMRLDRPFEKDRFRRDLSSRYSAPPVRRARGASGRSKNLPTSERFWRDYDNAGGILAKLGGQIYCFKDQDSVLARTEILRNLHNEQCLMS